MAKNLFILNDPPYGSEKGYNALRLARSLAQKEEEEIRVFLMGDAVVSALADQTLPDGYYHLDRMLSSLARRGAPVACCGTCMDARGIREGMLLDGASRSSMDELTEWTVWADKVVSF
jgi:uncharacterized protein involved in oxidation of intracellular sulfur